MRIDPDRIDANLLVNCHRPPFNNPDMRRAMAFSIDCKAFVDTLTQGRGQIGGILQPPPDGLWGMPPDQIATLPGYDPDVQRTAKGPAR